MQCFHAVYVKKGNNNDIKIIENNEFKEEQYSECCPIQVPIQKQLQL